MLKKSHLIPIKILILKSQNINWMTSKAFDVYRDFPFFFQEELDEIIQKHEKVVFQKGEAILQEGKMANEYYILEKGLARSFVNDFNGNDVTTNFFTENEIIIDVSSLFQRIPTQENIVCITDCECWKLDFDVFQELFHKIPNLREWGRAWMSQQLFLYKQRSVEMFTLSATKRYLHLLEQKSQVIQFAPLKQIASYLGITDTSLSRIRKEIVSHPKKN
ncbi:DNA-binding transcriptional dual regulator Crp [Chryseobacterium sp. MOF25P]|nr:DNA-binding transcriptional dual regulator Crp [Chryseobacterium sp. MOF25P]OBW46869.1 DNA-binding transcriptional dual regulator Crp [Chryseobacterium sp. BGARF1]